MISTLRCLAYLAPLLAGLGAAWALASSEGRPWRARLARLGLTLGPLLLAPLPSWPVSLIAASLAALVAAAYLAARAARAPAGPAQVAASLVPAALYGLLFAFAPLLSGADGDAIGRRITLGLELSPISAIAVSVFGETGFLHRPVFYAIDFAAYPHAEPRWTSTVAMYLGAAAALGALAFAFRKRSA